MPEQQNGPLADLQARIEEKSRRSQSTARNASLKAVQARLEAKGFHMAAMPKLMDGGSPLRAMSVQDGAANQRTRDPPRFPPGSVPPQPRPQNTDPFAFRAPAAVPASAPRPAGMPPMQRFLDEHVAPVPPFLGGVGDREHPQGPFPAMGRPVGPGVRGPYQRPPPEWRPGYPEAGAPQSRGNSPTRGGYGHPAAGVPLSRDSSPSGSLHQSASLASSPRRAEAAEEAREARRELARATERADALERRLADLSGMEGVMRDALRERDDEAARAAGRAAAEGAEVAAREAEFAARADRAEMRAEALERRLTELASGAGAGGGGAASMWPQGAAERVAAAEAAARAAEAAAGEAVRGRQRAEAALAEEREGGAAMRRQLDTSGRRAAERMREFEQLVADGIQTTQDAVEVQSRELAYAKENAVDLERRLAERDSKVEALTRELSACQRSLAEGMRSQAATAQGDLAAIEAFEQEGEALRAERGAQESAAAAAREDAAAARTALRAAERRAAGLEAALGERERAMDDLQGAEGRAKGAERRAADLADELDTLAVQLQQARAKLESNKIELEELGEYRSTYSMMEEELYRKKREAEEIRGTLQVREAEVARVRAERDALRARADGQSEDIRAHERAMGLMAPELAALREEAVATRDLFAAVEGGAEQVSQMRWRVEEELGALRQEAARMREDASHQGRALAQARQAVGRLQAEATSREAVVAALRAQLREKSMALLQQEDRALDRIVDEHRSNPTVQRWLSDLTTEPPPVMAGVEPLWGASPRPAPAYPAGGGQFSEPPPVVAGPPYPAGGTEGAAAYDGRGAWPGRDPGPMPAPGWPWAAAASPPAPQRAGPPAAAGAGHGRGPPPVASSHDPRFDFPGAGSESHDSAFEGYISRGGPSGHAGGGGGRERGDVRDADVVSRDSAYDRYEAEVEERLGRERAALAALADPGPGPAGYGPEPSRDSAYERYEVQVERVEESFVRERVARAGHAEEAGVRAERRAGGDPSDPLAGAAAAAAGAGAGAAAGAAARAAASSASAVSAALESLGATYERIQSEVEAARAARDQTYIRIKERGSRPVSRAASSTHSEMDMWAGGGGDEAAAGAREQAPAGASTSAPYHAHAEELDRAREEGGAMI